MMLWLRLFRGLWLAGLVLGGCVFGIAISAVATADSAWAQGSEQIVVQGNRRVEAETIRSYFRISPGGRLDNAAIDEALKALYGTGLFQDVRITPSGNRIVVTVVENPVINRVAFEGNLKLKDEQLLLELQTKPRGALSRPAVQADVQRLIEIYRRNGRFDVTVSPKIIELPNNRVDLVFEIKEGGKTGVRKLIFVGNNSYSDTRLKDEIKTSETIPLIGFLQTQDIYDPDRIEADRDLLRRFYLKKGYADVRIVSAVAVYDPAQKGFTVTFTIDEGRRYRYGKVEIISHVPAVEANSLYGRVRAAPGAVYNAEATEKSVENLAIEVARRGYPFAVVRPRGDRDTENAENQHCLRDRRGTARLHRAHQHPRQQPDTRLCHPPRVRYRRGRRLQPRADRPRGTAAEEPELLQGGQVLERAGLRVRPHRHQRRCRRAGHGRILDYGRLFDRRRLARRSQRRRTQPAGPRPVRQGVGAIWPARPRL